MMEQRGGKAGKNEAAREKVKPFEERL